MVGVSTWSYNFDIAMEFVDAVRRKHKKVPIVLGGPHVTFVDEEVLRTFPSVDFILRDEADATFSRLLRALETGVSIRVLEAAHHSVEVNRPEDVPRVEALLRASAG